MREVLIVAGEASGDMHAAALAEAIGRKRPDLSLVGVGGGGMERAGVSLLERTDRLAVMGFVEVLKQVPHHYRLLRSLGSRLAGGNVAVLVTIDYPGFNIRLAERAKRAGVPVLYYITPQVWAWGAGRLPNLARVITRAAVILPFEEDLLRQHGIDATFVGHPLLDRASALPDRAGARAQLGIRDGERVLALFPGSRQQEIHRHLADFVGSAQLLQQRYRDLRVIVSAAPGVRLSREECPYDQVEHASLVILRAADAALCKSGTTTLEAAVTGCPLVVAYRTSTWTHAIARRVVRIPNIGLVNVVAGRTVAPEFVQHALTPAAVSAALAPLLDQSNPDRARMVQALGEVTAKLGQPGASERVASIVSTLAA